MNECDICILFQDMVKISIHMILTDLKAETVLAKFCVDDVLTQIIQGDE